MKVRELARTHLHHAILSHGEVRHYRHKFDTCRKVLFWRPCRVQIRQHTFINWSVQILDTPPKTLSRVHLKKINRKKMFSPKRVSNLGRLTVPKIWNKHSQKRNCAAPGRIPTFLFMWAIYIFPWSVCLFCCRKIGGPKVGIYRLLTDTWMWKLGLRPAAQFLFWEY